MARQTKIALIDSHALIHRAYHALPPMSTRDGLPSNAVYGFTTMLLKMFATLKPTHVAAAFDMRGPTFRQEVFKGYKAHRKEADKDLITQFDLVRELVRAFNIPIIEKQGFEADDIIGTLTRKLDGGLKKIIVTGDMDTLQLVDEDTSVFTLKRGISDTILYTPETVREKYGFEPKLVADYKGLRGDPSDNIPGVAGIGDKTAAELVSKYGSIENIYEHLEELPKRAQTRLRDHKEDALFSRQLATIKCDVPVDFELSQASFSGYNPEDARALFEKFEFRSLIPRIPGSLAAGASPAEVLADTQRELKLPGNYRLVSEPDEQAKLRESLARQDLIAINIETADAGARQQPVIGLSFAAKINGQIKAWYVPVAPESVRQWRPLLENPAVGKIGHNLKHDYQVLRQSDITLAPLVFDSMIASYLLHPGARQHGLDTLAAQELNEHLTSMAGPMGNLPLSRLASYACEKNELAWRLYEIFAPKIKSEGLARVFEELEMPLVPVLAEMELAGIKVDAGALKKISRGVNARLKKLQIAIWQEAGEEFNINSTLQLRRILFEKLNLPTVGITRKQSGLSTAAAELGKLSEHHRVIALLEEYRELSKLLNTYIATLPQLIDKNTGRIHTTFNQTVTATGRLSSSDPNLQNIPARTELGQEIRAAFVAPAGFKFVKADYSQLELRLAAHLSQGDKMLEAFRSGADIHRATAAWVNNIKPEAVTDKQRRDAKTLNFGVLYGMGPQHFARASGVSVIEARLFIDRYQAQYPGLMRLLRQTVEQAETMGYVETILGRRRYLPEIKAMAPAIRSQAERAAFNFPIQGAAADILKKAMVELAALIKEKYPEAKMVLTVHDELVCEVPDAQTGEFAAGMRHVMENVMTLDVPLLADVSVGDNWRDVEKIADGRE